jgi:sugar phosphate isomerase/epimerase
LFAGMLATGLDKLVDSTAFRIRKRTFARFQSALRICSPTAIYCWREGNEMSDWAIGLSTGCFWQTSIFDCLEDIRNSGFGRIEICSFPAHLDYHDVERVKQAAGLIEQLSLETYSFHAPFADKIDITSPDKRARDFARDELFKAAEAAALLKVRYFVVHPGPENATLPDHERFWRLQNAVEVLNQTYAHCHSLGVGLVLENMLPHLFAGRVRDLLWILGALDTFHVGICLDTGHAYLGGDLPSIIRDPGHPNQEDLRPNNA